MTSDFKKELIIFASIIAGTVLVGGGFLLWMDQHIAGQAHDIANERFTFLQYSHTIDLLAELKRIAPLVKSYQEKMNLLLPQKDDLVEFSRWIEGLSRVNEVSVGFAFQGSTVAAQNQDAGFIGFTLDVSGADENIRNFFRELELRSNRFLTSIDNFDLTNTDGTVRVLARGKVFFK